MCVCTGDMGGEGSWLPRIRTEEVTLSGESLGRGSYSEVLKGRWEILLPHTARMTAQCPGGGGISEPDITYHTHTHTHTLTRTHTHLYMHARVHIHTHSEESFSMRTQLRTLPYMEETHAQIAEVSLTLHSFCDGIHASTHGHLHVCVCVCVYVCVCI